MPPGDTPFRIRAASLLHPFTSVKSSDEDAPSEKLSKSRRASTEPHPIEKPKLGQEGDVTERSESFSSNGRNGDHPVARGFVRSVPAWVQTLEEDEEDSDATSHLIPPGPPSAQIAQHNHSPAPKQKGKPEPGRLYDSQREWTPPMPRAQTHEIASQWRAFANASAYPAVSSNGGLTVDMEWLIQNGPDYSRPWLADAANEDTEKEGMQFWKSKRKVWWIRAQNTILKNPMIPLVFRSIVWIFSLVALGLAGSIYHRTRTTINRTNTPSTYMAIVVDAIALVYILYITYDEYTGKPLGLRSARAKMRLIFLDLIFIVFDSANLSLAYEGLITKNDSVCSASPNAQEICPRQKGLASVLLIALVAWLLTFSISVLRSVQSFRCYHITFLVKAIPTLKLFTGSSRE
ncbi:MAG: hypothetical protein HETSPECPRED_006317 [Heterodermia speciosa]|uniref:Regulator of phospholipase D SRF1 n=1 Tax=Heterodermia speciosa TaxID=116794 RepID=A0A8H3FKR5_9LECA|nr:MAG: hypothetical protein HETSPECPRED_006317 [Heterodermia speciosa]